MGLGVHLQPVDSGHGVHGHQSLVTRKASPAIAPVVARGQQPPDMQLYGYPDAEVAFHRSDGSGVGTGTERSVGVRGVVLQPASDPPPGIRDLPCGDRGGSRVSWLVLVSALLLVLGVR